MKKYLWSSLDEQRRCAKGLSNIRQMTKLTNSVVCLILLVFKKSIWPKPLFGYLLTQKIGLQNFELIFPVILRSFDFECHVQTSLKAVFVVFCLNFTKFRKVKSLHWQNKKLVSHSLRGNNLSKYSEFLIKVIRLGKVYRMTLYVRRILKR